MKVCEMPLLTLTISTEAQEALEQLKPLYPGMSASGIVGRIISGFLEPMIAAQERARPFGESLGDRLLAAGEVAESEAAKASGKIIDDGPHEVTETMWDRLTDIAASNHPGFQNNISPEPDDISKNEYLYTPDECWHNVQERWNYHASTKTWGYRCLGCGTYNRLGKVSKN